jgi:hypothetical protein
MAIEITAESSCFADRSIITLARRLQRDAGVVGGRFNQGVVLLPKIDANRGGERDSRHVVL